MFVNLWLSQAASPSPSSILLFAWRTIHFSRSVHRLSSWETPSISDRRSMTNCLVGFSMVICSNKPLCETTLRAREGLHGRSYIQRNQKHRIRDEQGSYRRIHIGTQRDLSIFQTGDWTYTELTVWARWRQSTLSYWRSSFISVDIFFMRSSQGWQKQYLFTKPRETSKK